MKFTHPRTSAQLQHVILTIAAAMFLALLALPATPASASNDALCSANQQIKYGTPNADTYVHTNGSGQAWCYDLLGGTDTYTNNSGWDDVVFGGPGNDAINGNDYGYETLDGGSGGDTLQGFSGNDVIYGGDGGDTIRGGGMNDTLFGADHCTETNYWGWWDMFDAGATDPAACSINDGGDLIYGGDGQKDWLWDSNSDRFADGVPDYLDGGDGTNDICTGGIEDTFVNCETVNIIPDV